MDYDLAVSAPFEIPVVFHILYDHEGIGLHADSTIVLDVDSLNNAFASSGISFRLVGIHRVQNDLWFYNLLTYQNAVSSAHHVDTERVLNVYVGDTSPVGGWSYLPGGAAGTTYDGVYIDYQSMPGYHPWNVDPYRWDGHPLYHETGHWLDLYHTFQGGCHDPADCLVDGDRVCDTPPESSSAWHGFNCHTEDSCPQPGDDPIYNYMDYTGDFCARLFTEGQFDRMRAAIGTYRPDLGDPIRYDRDLVVGTNESWHWYDTEIRFDPGYGIVVNGTMNADGTEFVAGNVSQGWDGIEVASGGSFTVDGPVTIDDTAVDVSGTFEIASLGELSVDGTTFTFAQDTRLDVSGDLLAEGVTFTAADSTEGWLGIRFNPSSGGSISDASVVEWVGVTAPDPGTIPLDYAITIQKASPTISGSFIQNSAPGSTSGGVYVSNSLAFPVITRNLITDLTGDGVVLDDGARARLIENTITLNDRRGLVGGYNTEAFLSGPPGSLDPANIIQSNGGYGVYATSSTYLYFGYSYSPQGGNHADGFNSVIENGDVGLAAENAGRIAAGTLTAQRKNRIYANAQNSSTPYDAAASGSGSRVYARCDWWDDTTPPFRTAAAGGGIVDDSWYLLQDPYVNPNPTCVEQGGLRLGGGAAARGGGTESGGETALDRLLAGVEVAPADPAAALATFAEVLAGWPEDPSAFAALAETGLIVTQANAPPEVQVAARRLLEAEAGGGEPGLRAAALSALTAARHREGDVAGALAAAEALVALGDSLRGGEDPRGEDAALFGYVASVYLYAEADRVAEAEAALLALEAVAPESVEAELARLHLEAVVEGMEPIAPPRSAVAAQAGVSEPARAAAFRLDPARPNPSGTGSAVVVPFVVTAPARVRMVLYDVLGREVAVLADGEYAVGRHAVPLTAGAALAPGAYFVRAAVTAAGRPPLVQTQTLTILR